MKKLLINGRFVEAQSGKSFPVINPATEEVITHVAEGDKADVDEAVKAARKAFEEGPWGWPRFSPGECTKLLIKVAELIDQHHEELAEILTSEVGKLIKSSRQEVTRVAEVFRYFSGWPTKIFGETIPSEPGMFNFTLREPVGVCGAIIPWNVPLAMAAAKICPALACGNTIILKPAEQAPLAVLRLGELIMEAGFPAGVVNIITGFGKGAGSAIVEHPGIDKVTFTGSLEVGKKILQAASGNLKRVSLELGGKSPNIIFADADLPKAIDAALKGIITNQGQMCTAGTRIFVQKSIHDEVTEELAKRMESLVIGDPLDAKSDLGPLVSHEQHERVLNYITVGQKEGAHLKTGSDQRAKKIGYFVKPTLFTNVHPEMRIVKEEIFGPVGVIQAFKDEEDAIFQGNDTPYGLVAGIWTKDISRALATARRLRAGRVWINCYQLADHVGPFGGYKQSGIGREGSQHVLDLFTEIKSVMVKL